MSETPRRLFGVLCVMVVVWIATYWLYQPAMREPRVTHGETPPDLVIDNPGIDNSTGGVAAPPPGSGGQGSAGAAAANQPPVTPDPPPMITRSRVEPPAFREYTVQRGDVSLEAIAQRELGDRRLWRAIAEANPFLTPDKLYPGRTVLKIPLDPANIQGRVVEVQTPAPPPTPPENAASPPTPVEPAMQEYTIAPGDTLTGISKQFYGTVGLWRIIYEANRGTLKDPDRLPRGAKIKIPPKPVD